MTTGCAGCRERDELIRELEEALEGSAYVRRGEAGKITAALRVSEQQANVILLLYRTGINWMPSRDLLVALPASDHPGPKGRVDPDIRCEGFISPVIHKVRTRWGRDFVESQNGSGYRLSAEGRARVAEILKS